MRIKALTSFSGVLSMKIGEVREYDNKVVLSDLLQAKYIEEIKPEKEVKSNESKRNTGNKRSGIPKK